MHIQMRGVCKSFSQVAVLKDVDFSVSGGEVHALMGENGAGKSTLMKVLTGVYTKDAGEILVDGRQVNFSHPKQAEEAGIVFVYQELNTMNDMTVEENMFMGKEITKALGMVDKKAMVEKARRTIERLGVSIDPNAVMGTLSVGQQQMVEIAKALLADVKFIIMDEPTAALSPAETRALFSVIDRLKKDGVSIIYISHRMEEIFEICDRITVLRDGRYISTKNTNETDMTELVRMMIGRDIGERFPKREVKIGPVLFEARGLSKKGVFEEVSFSVRSGEVLGVAGLMGAGRTEIMKAIFGSLLYEKGTIMIHDKPVRIKSPLDAIKLGMGFITEDRKVEGLMLNDGINTNISLNNLKLISDAGILSKTKEDRLISEAISKLLIKCSGPKQLCSELSGGNQQKVVFAKWMYTNPRLLILDEPTRGVDVGAKKEIYSIINELVENGVAVVLVSSDLPEVLGMSDRIMAIHEGRVGGIVEKEDATQENVMLLCTGGTL
jgi:ribose transport system ATP-binding protein